MFYCRYDEVCEHILQKDKLFSKIKDPKTFIVKLFPYFCDNQKGNIAKYARGKDYHLVVKERLDAWILELLHKYPQGNFVSFCDISPLPEVLIAYKSGAGILGKQGLIFDEKYGGYVFIGIIATDVEFEKREKKLRTCENCGKCVSACPSGALRNADFTQCLSHQTQTNDEVDLELIAKSPLIWGCDICLDVCPMNKKPAITDIIDFSADLVYDLHENDVLGQTRKSFALKYPNRAFTFRGPSPIMRNLKVRKNK